MELVCDNRRVRHEVRALHDTCESAGAILHPALRMMVASGNIWLESDLPRTSKETLISLPQSCLPPVDAFELAVRDEEIRVTGHRQDLPVTQARCFEHMIAIYNATAKLRAHRAASPWFALQDHPEMLDRLIAARTGTQHLSERRDRLREEGHGALLLDTFLAARQYPLRDPESGTPRPVLMPFLEFADHHHAAPGFQRPGPDAPADHRVALTNAKPVAGSDECRVAYGILDALDTYLAYGFVDTETEIVRSVPLTIRLEAGEIDASARTAPGLARNVPAKLSDLGPMVPRILSRSDATLSVSHLLLPGSQTPHALRRILNWLIRNLLPGVTLGKLREWVLDAEGQVLAANRAFWDEMASWVDARHAGGGRDPSLDAVRRLVAHQDARLRDYEMRMNR